MRTLLIGPSGQVGSALLERRASLGEVVPLDHPELDLASADSIHRAVRELRPQVIINAAAYTAVDQAEREETLAFRVNAHGPAILAEEAARLGALLVHFSTDYVFDGEKPTPYVETDPPNPLNVYGRSKLAGDQAIQASGCRYLIFRTSWVYGSSGKNFVLTMLRLAREGKPLRVVDDQHGAPTSSRQIARAVREILLAGEARREMAPDDMKRVRAASGLYHATAAGVTTWFGFAAAILAERARMPGACVTAPKLTPITTGEYNAPAKRPANSVLSNAKLAATFGVRMQSWERGLEETLSALG